MDDIKKLKENIIYLQILKSCSAVYADEFRTALDVAIKVMQEKIEDIK